MQIFIHKNGQQLGPLSEAEVKAQLAAGILSRQDLVWWEGQAGWAPLEQTPLAAGSSVNVPPPAPAVVPPPASPAGLIAGERTSTLAIVSLVTGIAGFLCGITSIVAIVCGHLSLAEIKKNPAIKGRGMAIAGLVLGYIWVAMALLYVLLFSLLGANVKKTFETINAQIEAAQTNHAPASTGGQ